VLRCILSLAQHPPLPPTTIPALRTFSPTLCARVCVCVWGGCFRAACLAASAALVWVGRGARGAGAGSVAAGLRAPREAPPRLRRALGGRGPLSAHRACHRGRRGLRRRAPRFCGGALGGPPRGHDAAGRRGPRHLRGKGAGREELGRKRPARRTTA